MPTETKKTTEKRSFKGCTSCRAWWAQIDSLTMMPAKKAPKAIDKPILCESRAMPRQSPSRVSRKSSLEFERAAWASTTGNILTAPKTTIRIKAIALPAERSRSLSEVVPSLAIRGKNGIIKTKERSCRMAMESKHESVQPDYLATYILRFRFIRTKREVDKRLSWIKDKGSDHKMYIAEIIDIWVND